MYNFITEMWDGSKKKVGEKAVTSWKINIFNPQVMEVDGSDNLPDFDLGDFLGEPAVHFFFGGGAFPPKKKLVIFLFGPTAQGEHGKLPSQFGKLPPQKRHPFL